MLLENEIEELQKEYIRYLFPFDKVYLDSFPSLSQCIGTKRLWSWRLGKSFSFDIGEKSKSKHLEKIAYLSRTYLVIHDFLKDEFISDDVRRMGREWLSYIERVLREEILTLGGNPDEFSSQLQRCEEGYNNINSTNILEKAITKCYIFFNPYNLLTLSMDTKLQNKRLEFLKDFFIICQILDDYCDIESDITKKRNHNLFMIELEERDINDLIVIKKLIAPSLLKSLKTFLSKHSKLKEEENEIISYYYNYALKWLSIKGESFSFDGSYKFIEFDCSNWRFRRKDLAFFKELSRSVKAYGRFDDIRPEFLQADFHISELD